MDGLLDYWIDGLVEWWSDAGNVTRGARCVVRGAWLVDAGYLLDDGCWMAGVRRGGERGSGRRGKRVGLLGPPNQALI